MCNHHNDQKDLKKPLGSALEHGEAHEKDHRRWSRRNFIRNIGLAGGASMLLGRIPVSAMGASPLSIALNNNDSDRVLVMIRLKGGNDGLNTIVPIYDFGRYQSARPTIHIPQNELVNLDSSLAMPNTMQPVESMWLDGKMKVVNNVGYPDQNLSHFRSSDIWGSASDASVLDSSGWMGRYLEKLYPDFVNNPPENPPAIQIGGAGSLIFTGSDSTNLGFSVTNPQQLAEIAQNGQLFDTANLPDCFYGEQLGYVRAVANSTFFYADIIAQAYENGTNGVEYQYSLGEQLALVARLIKGGLKTKIYMVSLDGFDTHAGQGNIHPYLLQQLSSAIKDFYEDLALGARDQDVLSMTFSEFGRRIEQNASGGTDHGAAAPLMLFGEGVNGNGFVGGLPDMEEVDQVGNLKFTVDFRQVYATVLENWLCVDADTVDMVLGQSFERLMDLDISCSGTTSTNDFAAALPINHHAIYRDGQIIIEYNLPKAASISVNIFNLLGQPIATLFDGYQIQGGHQAVFNTRNAAYSAGIYVYSIQVGKQVYSQKIRVF